MQRITVSNVSAQQIGLGNAHTIVIGDSSYNPYEGEYRITPSSVPQTLVTQGRSMQENIVVEAIPQNYGLITYNGFELTVT